MSSSTARRAISLRLPTTPVAAGALPWTPKTRRWRRWSRNPRNLGYMNFFIRSVNYLTHLDRFLSDGAERGWIDRPSGKCRFVSVQSATDYYIGRHMRRKRRLWRERLRVPGLTIFDCDGVLVDSELTFARVLAECLTAVDFSTTLDEAITLGFGTNRVTLSAAVATRFARALPDAFLETFASRSAAAFELELSPMAGVKDLLAALLGAAVRSIERPSGPCPPTPRDNRAPAVFRPARVQRHPGRSWRTRTRPVPVRCRASRRGTGRLYCGGGQYPGSRGGGCRGLAHRRLLRGRALP